MIQERLDILKDEAYARISGFPPLHLQVKSGYSSTGRFKSSGETFFRWLISLGNLKPYERVLDVGCGAGCLALPLRRYLTPAAGSYEGIDILSKAIMWCRRYVTRDYPNFRFTLCDVANPKYNPWGSVPAGTYTFPYADNSFDVVCVKSLFPHMKTDAMAAYIHQIRRVLKPRGRCLMTLFLINTESRKRKPSRFAHQYGDYFTSYPFRHEEDIAYEETGLITLLREHGLNIHGPVHYGSWSGRKYFLGYQDLIIVIKE